jgi:hypothetical protein
MSTNSRVNYEGFVTNVRGTTLIPVIIGAFILFFSVSNFAGFMSPPAMEFECERNISPTCRNRSPQYKICALSTVITRVSDVILHKGTPRTMVPGGLNLLHDIFLFNIGPPY